MAATMAECQPLIGPTITHYRILVYKAQITELARLVALKFPSQSKPRQSTHGCDKLVVPRIRSKPTLHENDPDGRGSGSIFVVQRSSTEDSEKFSFQRRSECRRGFRRVAVAGLA
jgi:hypothetical protein